MQEVVLEVTCPSTIGKTLWQSEQIALAELLFWCCLGPHVHI